MTVNTDAVTLIILALMVAAAAAIIFVNRLIYAVVFMSTFSTLAALVFLLIGAPDVALAEIVIGSTLSTIIFLISIKKHKLFIVYVVNDNGRGEETTEKVKGIVKIIERYLKDNERQIHIIKTDFNAEALKKVDEQKVIIESASDDITVHFNCESAHTEELVRLVGESYQQRLNIVCDHADFEVSIKEELKDD